MNLSKLREILEDRRTWHSAVHGVTVRYDLATEQEQHEEQLSQCRSVDTYPRLGRPATGKPGRPGSQCGSVNTHSRPGRPASSRISADTAGPCPSTWLKLPDLPSQGVAWGCPADQSPRWHSDEGRAGIWASGMTSVTQTTEPSREAQGPGRRQDPSRLMF